MKVLTKIEKELLRENAIIRGEKEGLKAQLVDLRHLYDTKGD